MQKKHTAILMAFLIAISATPTSSAAEYDETIPVLLDYAFEVGDMFGARLTVHYTQESSLDGSVDVTNVLYKLARIQSMIDGVGIYNFVMDFYENLTDNPTFPPMGSELESSINLDDWNKTDNDMDVEIVKTRESILDSVFILPRSVGYDELYTQDIEEDFIWEHLKVSSIFQLLQNKAGFVQDENFSNESMTIVSDFNTAEIDYERLYEGIGTDGHTYEGGFTCYLEVVKEEYGVMDMRLIDKRNNWTRTDNGDWADEHVSILMERVYLSRDNFDSWLYNNWRWFLPIIIVIVVGAAMLGVYFYLRSQCGKGKENFTCRNPRQSPKK